MLNSAVSARYHERFACLRGTGFVAIGGSDQKRGGGFRVVGAGCRMIRVIGSGIHLFGFRGFCPKRRWLIDLSLSAQMPCWTSKSRYGGFLAVNVWRWEPMQAQGLS